MGILNICNLWILLREIVIYTKMSSSWTFSLLKLTEVMSQRESLYMKTSLQIPTMTSLPSTLTAKKFMKMTFSSDKIYYNFSQENLKITKIAIDVKRTLTKRRLQTIAMLQLIKTKTTQVVTRTWVWHDLGHPSPQWALQDAQTS